MNIRYTTQFKKDYKRLKRQNKDLDKLKVVIAELALGNKLDTRFKDHPLSGNWSGHRDCHIETDWILIYRTAAEELVLERTGSHSELFNK